MSVEVPMVGGRLTPDVTAHQLVVVTGKGGVGKSTVAAALGLLAVSRGRRAIIVEVAGRDDVRRALTGSTRGPAHVEREVAPRLWHLSIDPRAAVAEYLREQLPVGPLASLLVHDRSFGLLAAAAPGLAELLTVGKAWRLTQPRRGRPAFDVVVLDAPSSGHVVALLRAPRTFAGVAARGPVGAQAARIDAFLTDPARTSVVVVATAEGMAVSEALALRASLARELGISVARYVVDGVLPEHFDEDEAAAVARLRPGRARHAALFAARLGRRQAHHVRRLADAVAPVPVVSLPLVAAPALGPAELRELAARLATS